MRLPLPAGKLEGACTAGQLPAPKYNGTTVALASKHGGSGYIANKVGVDSLVLVDSGATLVVIPKQVWLEITKGRVELLDHQGDVSAANGGRMGILGTWHCTFDSHWLQSF